MAKREVTLLPGRHTFHAACIRPYDTITSLYRAAIARRYLEMAEDERRKGNLKAGIEYLSRAIHTTGKRGEREVAIK